MNLLPVSNWSRADVALHFKNIPLYGYHHYNDTRGVHWNLCLCFKQALPHVQPSSKREGFATVPDVTWKDIGALEDVREELSISIMVTNDIFLTSFLVSLRTVLEEVSHVFRDFVNLQVVNI